MNNVKTILLDVDNTLLDFHKAQRNALIGAFDLLGYPYDEALIDRYDLHNKEYWRKFERGEITREKLVIERFETFFDVENIDGDAIKCERAYRETLGEQHDFIDGAKEALIYLSSKYEINLITNGLMKTQYSRLRLAGIDKYVNKIFISEEVGSRKPEREFFEYVFANLPDAEIDTSLVIGDSLSSDISGGVNYGISCLWFNPKNKPGSFSPQFHSWREITDIL